MTRRPSLALVLALAALAAPRPAAAQDALPSISLLGRPAAAPAEAAVAEAPGTRRREPALGRSGALRVAIVSALEALNLPFLEAVEGPGGRSLRWVPLFGTRTRLLGEPTFSSGVRAPDAPGVWRLDAVLASGEVAPRPLTVITRVPFSAKRGGYLNGYHIGTYPAEHGSPDERYALPGGFIEVTPENQELQISEHFRLRHFLTKDQFDVWPKYVVISPALIDKLELVLQELDAMGVRADRMHVMSGYRTPQYNGPGGDGRARLSRHTYGDAADVWVDNDGNGYMDDLDGDGRVDVRDAQVMLRAVDRVERRHPDLVGGAGVYSATSAHGPFIHIDVRGARARW